MKAKPRFLLDRLLSSENGLLVDPVESFFNGIGSGLGRGVCGMVAILGGAALCMLPYGVEGSRSLGFALGPLLIGLAFVWAMFGLWWFVGLAALLTMLTAFWTFLQDIHAKRSFFIMFTAATVYYLPLSFAERHWIAAGLLYALCSAIYWLLPFAWSRWQTLQAARQAVAEDETASPDKDQPS